MTENKEEVEKALELIQAKRIKKIHESELKNGYIVTGKNDDYLVITPNYCTCQQFQINCLKESGKICKHILAVNMSTEISEYTKQSWLEILNREY
ncbi:MAG: SWIM zinc finger family protein [Candidatus Heimdallarchaeota archaeon]|nr:SWIM zinc finger family protein [Candidatus Heimdallarchaeota archaeon]MDH5645530.1 SWIM zinc finger family protein [Candidatus Heimdallarchaeota archaeon]